MEFAEASFLVVEPDEFQRRWIVVVLFNLGARNIVEAADGVAAREVLQDPAVGIDISIINLHAAGMDGIELIRHIARENHPGSVVLTGTLDSSLSFSVQTMAKGYGVDVLGTLDTPATPEALQALVDRYRMLADRNVTPANFPNISEADIRHGLANREFEPLFQPKVELATGLAKGAEAFTRWRHPQYGLVEPSTFIPLLEQLGEMEAFAWIVIDKSIAACIKWHQQGYPISVSINLSPSCLAYPDFAEKLIDFAAARHVDPRFIVIEVTESAVISSKPHFLDNLARLRLKGFGITVDDYGTGHASMQELLQIPFSELKIDQSFVVGASSNQALELVLSASFEICRKLNKQSVAVGVESKQDWDFLQKLGCTYAQGYYIAKPMEAEDLPAWMEEWAHFF